MRWLGPSACLGIGLFALATFLAGIATHDLWSFLDGLASGAIWIDVNTGTAGAVPAAVAIGCWSLILLGLRMTDRTERRIMGLSFACVPLIVLLPLAFMVVTNAVLSEKGYERCHVDPSRRFPGTRYMRTGLEACP